MDEGRSLLEAPCDRGRFMLWRVNLLAILGVSVGAVAGVSLCGSLANKMLSRVRRADLIKSDALYNTIASQSCEYVFPSNTCMFIANPSTWNHTCADRQCMLAGYTAAHPDGPRLAREIASTLRGRTVVFVGPSIMEQFWTETVCALAGLGERYSLQTAGSEGVFQTVRHCVRFHHIELQVCYFVAEKTEESPTTFGTITNLNKFVGLNDIVVFGLDAGHTSLETADVATTSLLGSLSTIEGLPHLVWLGGSRFGCGQNPWGHKFNSKTLPVVREFGIPIVEVYDEMDTLSDEWYSDSPDFCMHRCQGGPILQVWDKKLLEVVRQRLWTNDDVIWKPQPMEVIDPPLSRTWGSLEEKAFVVGYSPEVLRTTVLYPWLNQYDEDTRAV